MSASWPTNWQGQTHLDCGSNGQVLTLVTTSNLPSGIHHKNFQLIVERWEKIWPEFRTVITELMESYKHDSPDWSCMRTLYVELSDEPIAEDAEWSVGVVFSAADTLWTLPYRGWSAVRGQAQAMW